jgi:phosphoserine aminotransferase
MKHNFGAGPCILPQEVFKKASEAVLNFDDTGLSILEISHRTKEFEAVVTETEALIRELLDVPEGYSILLLQGGARQQFAMVPMNLLPLNGKSAYLDSGSWASQAIKEARFFSEVDVVASSKDKNYSYVPKEYSVSEDATYFHYTSNNTIFGTELFDVPNVKAPIVCDMSSDIMSRKIDVSKYGIIYAGAQKNIGPAGLTIVIVKDELLGKTGKEIPSIFDYRSHINAKSMFNTPPVYSIYVAMLNLRWLKALGGVEEIERENIIKSRTLYEEIDRNSLFQGAAEVEDRSRMNVTFVTKNPEHEASFLELVKARDLVGLKGHRSVGGFRASLYNALPLSSVHALINAMQEFEEKNA